MTVNKNKEKVSSGVKDLINFLDQDRSQPFPQYPETAIQAFSNPIMIEAIEGRLSKDMTLKNIISLGYNMAIGVDQIVFEFSEQPDLTLKPSGVLALINGEGQAVAIIDPFNINQPNQNFPPFDIRSSSPFVLSRPSEAVIDTIEPDSIDESDAASAFLARLPGAFGGNFGGLLAERKICPNSNDTRCQMPTARQVTTPMGTKHWTMTDMSYDSCDSPSSFF